MRIKKTVLSAAVITAAFLLSSCGESPSGGNNNGEQTDGGAPAPETAAPSVSENVEVLNFIPPEIGEEIAVITVKDYGEIKIKLFENEAPKAVENFKGLANMNYYDELIFHRVIPNFMIQGGDPKGNGTGGNSMWGGNFDGGTSDKLRHFTGAVAYANSQGPTTNTSQFYIVNTPETYINLGGVETIDYFGLPANVSELYNEKGGTPFLDGGYTVFGQVFEGMETVWAIAGVETDPSNDKPLTQVMMETVRIVEYTGE